LEWILGACSLLMHNGGLVGWPVSASFCLKPLQFPERVSREKNKPNKSPWSVPFHNSHVTKKAKQRTRRNALRACATRVVCVCLCVVAVFCVSVRFSQTLPNSAYALTLQHTHTHTHFVWRHTFCRQNMHIPIIKLLTYLYMIILDLCLRGCDNCRVCKVLPFDSRCKEKLPLCTLRNAIISVLVL